MEAKFRKKLSDYKYLVMFDLASKTTGVCIWDVTHGKPVASTAIVVPDRVDNRARGLWDALDDFFVRFALPLGVSQENAIVHRELCPLQQGRFTTAKTLIALGKAHAVLDLYLAEKGWDYYDLDGVSPSTTHAFFRRIRGLTPKDKVEKEDMRSYLAEEYGIDPRIGLDESDAIFLAKTFAESFWDKELDDEMRNERRHIKGLKAPAAIRAGRERLEFLASLKIGKADKEAKDG